MAAEKKLILNATEMHTPGHIAWGLWRLPDSDTPHYTTLRYWTDLAKLLEDGGFDSLFIADALGQLDTFRKDADAALVTAAQTPLDDPLLVISGMAAVTSTLGFGVTVSATYEQPYLLARKFTTLDHLTGGRIGWNIVTSQLDSAARNLGYDRQIPHDERYERAQEFVEVAYKLWEGSWEDDAVVLDRESGVYADPRKVHAIGHRGRYYSVPSAALSEPSVQRTPLLFQAGSSPRGREFAARNAEVVFVAGHDPYVLRRNIGAIKKLAVDHGGQPDAIKFVASTLVITDSSDAAAEAKLRDYQRYYSVEGALTHFSAVTGIDWSQFDPDAPLEYLETESNRSFLAAITKDAPPGSAWTLRKYLAPENGVSYTDSIVGSGKSVARQLAEFAEVADLDGFNLNGANPHQSYRDLAEHVIPELRARGLVRERVQGQTLRQRIFRTDDPRLPADHPGAAYRGAFTDRPSSAPTLL